MTWSEPAGGIGPTVISGRPLDPARPGPTTIPPPAPPMATKTDPPLPPTWMTPTGPPLPGPLTRPDRRAAGPVP